METAHATNLGVPIAVAKTAAKEKRDVSKAFIEWYKTTCYRHIGAKMDQTPDPTFALKLKQAGYGLTPGMYRAVRITTVAFGAVLGGLFASLLFVVAFDAAWFMPLALAVLVGVSTYAAFPFAVSTRISNRTVRLERELPFSLSELAVLSSIGLSPIEIMRRMARRGHDPAMTGEFRRVVHKTDLQGKDIVTALAETAKESPSKSIRDTFWDLANMIHQGGSLDEYLRSQSDKVLDLKRAGQKQFIDRLSTYADMYVTLVLIGVMFLGVGAFLMDAFGTSAGGLSASAVLQLLTYGLVPLIVIVLGLILSTAQQKAGD